MSDRDEKADSPSMEWGSIKRKESQEIYDVVADDTLLEPPKEIALHRELSARQISMIAVSLLCPLCESCHVLTWLS